MSRLTLEILTGLLTGRRITLTPGGVATVGRGPANTLPVPADPDLAGVHFGLEFGPDACLVRDLGSPAGLFVNGVRVAAAALNDNDHVRAGTTTFGVQLTAGPAAPPTVTPRGPAGGDAPPAAIVHTAAPAPTDLRRLLLLSDSQPLFAIVDAARGPAVHGVLHAAADVQCQSLYDGARGNELARVAPHLVRLAPASPILDALVARGFGRSWGVYLTSAEPFADVRRHLRRFLLVKTEAGKQLYFRYYDPRVLPLVLPELNAAELADFFGPVGSYLAEGEDRSTLLRFSLADGALRRQPFAVTIGRPATEGVTVG
ncbi:DUF4123 domain-containing protein [Sphingomonas sp.]|uniref:DUF4123 domain-containing protein n=1 Tax=Sphingomonas sp. TaxID=28214 RepID=UPI003B00B79C